MTTSVLGGTPKRSSTVFPPQFLVHRVVSFGDVDEAREDRGSLLPRQLVGSLDPEQHVEPRAARAEAAPLLREDTFSLAVVARTWSDDLQQHFAGVCDEGHASVVATLQGVAS